MSNRLKAEPAFIKSLSARLFTALAEVMERDGIQTLSVTDLRVLSEALNSSQT